MTAAPKASESSPIPGEDAPSTGHDRPGPKRSILILAGLGVVAAALLVYLPSLSNEFVNWDDPIDVVKNPYVHALDGPSVEWMFTETLNGNWIPLNWLSHALVCHFFGLDPAAHHAANVVLHGINAFLVFLLFAATLRLIRTRSSPGDSSIWYILTAAMGALFWAIHPLHVESVAWVTERKDVGSTLFFLLSVLCYLRHATARGARPAAFGLSLVFFVFSLLFKPMAVTLPLVLLLLDAWPLERLSKGLRRVLLEKIPFVLVAVLSGIVAIAAQGGAVAAVAKVPFGFRVMNAFHSIIFYMVKMIVPVDLAAIYPITDPSDTATSLPYLAAALGVIAISAVCFLLWRRGLRAVPIAWCFYLVTLGPVIGILQVGVQAAADRYTYLPTLSLSLLAAALVLAPGIALPRFPRAIVFLAALCVLGFLCVGQIGVWKNSLALWEHQVGVYPNESERAYSNLGRAYAELGRTDDAINAYRRAMAIDTPHARTHDALGCALLDKEQIDAAIAEFKLAIAKDRNYAEPWRNLAIASVRKGKTNEAVNAVRQALRINPRFSEAWFSLGNAFLSVNRLTEAADAFGNALDMEAQNPTYLSNLATTRMRQNRLDEAIELFAGVVQMSPQDAKAMRNLGLAYLKKGLVQQAVPHLGRAAELDPSEPPNHQLLGEALEQSGQKQKAVAAYQNAIRADERFAAAHASLTRLYLERGDMDAARRHGRRAIELGVPIPPAVQKRLFGP